MNARRNISLGFTETTVPEGQHICYLFNDEAERRRTMSKYLQSGLDAREKVLYLVDTMTTGEFAECMAELGLDVSRHQHDLVLQEALPVYCPGGTFSVPDMLKVVGEFYQQSLQDGYVGSRGTGEMSWCLVDGRARKEDIMEYEARLTQVLEQYPYTACCQYDARRFDGETIMDVLSVHPMMIVRGQVVKNPFFQPPEEFLASYRRRHEGAVHG
jgi:hypothetical protein